jgi:hypothetical protein
MSWANMIKKQTITNELIPISNYLTVNEAPSNVHSYPYPHYVKSVAYECFVSMKEEADNHYYNIFQHIAPNSYQELEHLIVNYMEHNSNALDSSQNTSNNDNTMNNSEDSWWDGGVRNRFAYS